MSIDESTFNKHSNFDMIGIKDRKKIKYNTFSKMMQKVFNPDEKTIKSQKESSKNIQNYDKNIKNPLKKFLSKTIITNKNNFDEGFVSIPKYKSSKSFEEKQLNKDAFIEEFFDCDCCSVNDINYLNNDYELQWVKKNENIRKSYITKLILNKVWEPINKVKQHNSLIIFDWDDTLLCTTFLSPSGLFNENYCLSNKDIDKIKKLEENVYKILKLAISKGDTYIITNAAPGWVEYSSNRFYPKICELLHNVKVVSARGKYEKEFPNDSRMWKIQAFLEMQKNFNKNLVTNIICLGDSIIEMEAAQIIAAKFTQAFIKTIKFKEAPRPDELNKQLLLVLDQFNKIYSGVKNLTIRVEKKTKNES